ncbi:unnamed protein product [Lymnaea stagnalis]|uniref:G-protein coupled receptors family 1 profile domain-containing protein n=1 Tax=Lymnaea stagnalis TaxID=6523 RepID=A0AAV2HWL5_LYMST
MALTTSRPGGLDATSPNYSSLLGDITTSLLAADNRTTAASIFLDNFTSFAGNDTALNDSMSCVFNATLNATVCASNATQVKPYVLPHSIGLTVFLGLLAGVVSLVTILGNITVLLAFGLERTIRQPTNYFLASLAVSDLLIGTFSMPLYSQYLLWGKWPLGPWLCDLWLSLDWTVCLTSQYTVFLITMDRFLSVKIPAKYRNWRTERKVMVMISITWILPAIVFFTSIVGWQYFVGKRTVKEEACEVQFMEDTMFTFLLTIGYYWITLVVMFILYGGIYKVALDLQRKSDEKHKKMQSTMELAGDNPNAAIRSFGNDHDGGVSNNSSGGGDSQVPPPERNNRKSKKKILEHNNSRRSVVNTTSFSTNNAGADKDDDRSSSPAFASDDDNSSSGGAVGTAKSPLTPTVYSGKPHPTGVVNSVLYTNTGGLGHHANNCANNQPPSDTNEDSGRSDTHCLSAVRRRQNKNTRLHSFVKSVRSRNSRRRNRRERKSKSENRARKALRTISFILGAFVLCWTPYHIALMVIALCTNCVNIYLYSFSYWMCYLNSPINPFCYAFANAQFKRTFLRIMRFDWHRT